MKLGLVQMRVCASKEENLKTAADAIRRLAERGAELVVLPEMFCAPYENSAFLTYAEGFGGLVTETLSRLAREHGVYLVGGSMPEREGDALYNTSFVFSPAGECIARHRKVHLFDVNIPNGQVFCESDTFTAGEEVTVFDTAFGKVGLCICFDIRFPELYRKMALLGAQLIVCPAAFNRTTGPVHWELLHRARAVDYQVFVCGCSPATDASASYVAYGHSIAVSPWGEVLAQAGEEVCELLVDLDFAKNDEIRKSLPLIEGMRPNLYKL